MRWHNHPRHPLISQTRPVVLGMLSALIVGMVANHNIPTQYDILFFVAALPFFVLMYCIFLYCEYRSESVPTLLGAFLGSLAGMFPYINARYYSGMPKKDIFLADTIYHVVFFVALPAALAAGLLAVLVYAALTTRFIFSRNFFAKFFNASQTVFIYSAVITCLIFPSAILWENLVRGPSLSILWGFFGSVVGALSFKYGARYLSLFN